jgi:hypothetical protein
VRDFEPCSTCLPVYVMPGGDFYPPIGLAGEGLCPVLRGPRLEGLSKVKEWLPAGTYVLHGKAAVGFLLTRPCWCDGP